MQSAIVLKMTSELVSMSSEKHGGIRSPHLPIIITSYMNCSRSTVHTHRGQGYAMMTSVLGHVSKNKNNAGRRLSADPWAVISCYKQPDWS